MWEGKGVVKTARQMLGETDPVSSKNWVINCEIPWWDDAMLIIIILLS